MTLLALILACGFGAVIGLAARPSGRIVRLVGLACLAAAFAAALSIGPTTELTVGEVTLAGSEYSGFFLACVAGSGLLLGAVALISGWPDELIPAALASLAGLAVAITAADPGVALIAGAAGATAGALVVAGAATAGTTPRSSDDDGRLAEIRTVGFVAAGLGLAAIAIIRPSWNGPSDGAVFGLAFLGLGGALAIRGGAVPFHVPAARLRRTAVPLSPALLLVWIPAGLGILAMGWNATTFGLRTDWLSAAVLAVQIVAVATLVLGPLAALVHDEIEEVAVYSIVADASFVLLAMAARTDAAAEPARLWLIVFVAAKTGLVAWAAALSRAFGTSSLDRLRGWLRRTPLLGVALAIIVVATLGWPGSAVYEARSTLIRLALPSGLQFVFAGSIVLSLACCGRLLVVGLRTPTEDVRLARSELPRWSAGTSRPTETQAAFEPAPAVETVLAASEAPSNRGAHRRVAGLWRLNRTLAVSLVVVLGSVLAAGLASGGMGAANASHFGIPLDTAAHATPTRAPTPPPSPTASPTAQPTFAPRPSAGASGSAAPSASASATASPAPGKTSAPARDNTD